MNSQSFTCKSSSYRQEDIGKKAAEGGG